MTIDNFIDYDPSTGGIKVVLTSVRNPNQGKINEGIKVFILSSPSTAQEYCPNLGPMTFVASPPILMMPYFENDDPKLDHTRENPDY